MRRPLTHWLRHFPRAFRRRLEQQKDFGIRPKPATADRRQTQFQQTLGHERFLDSFRTRSSQESCRRVFGKRNPMTSERLQMPGCLRPDGRSLASQSHFSAASASSCCGGVHHDQRWLPMHQDAGLLPGSPRQMHIVAPGAVVRSAQLQLMRVVEAHLYRLVSANCTRHST